MLVDWCEWTEHGRSVDEVCARFGAARDWVELGRGALGYRGARRHTSGVRVLYDGRPDMGVHVEVDGDACRRLEYLGLTRWEPFLSQLGKDGRKLSRFDVAMDEREGLVDIEVCVESAVAGVCVSRFRKCRPVPGGIDLAHPERPRTQTLYFGAPTSDVQMRMYDKAVEQGVEGHWARLEVQARDERAQLLAAHLAEHGLGAVAGIVRGYLDFKVPGRDSNRWRWASCGWWDAFLQGAAKSRVHCDPKAPKKLAERVRNAEKQYGPTLAAEVEVNGVASLVGIAERGRARWREEHHAVVKEAMAAA